MKKDGSFNGDVQFELWYLGELIEGPTEKTLTTDYAQYSISADSADITEDGVLTLRVKARGTAGNVYADDLEYLIW
jgi:hypothetical protein